MVLSFMCIPSIAEENAELTVLSIDKLRDDGEVVESAVGLSEVSCGDIVAVTIGVRAGSKPISACGYQFKLNYNNNVFELWSQNENRRNNFFETSYSNLVIKSSANKWSAPVVKDSNANSVALAAAYAKSTDGDYKELNTTADAGESIDIVQIAFRVKNDAETGTAWFSFNENYENLVTYYYEVASSAVKGLNTICSSTSIHVNGVTPVLNEVTLDKSSVTVDGETGKTVNATAASAQDTNLTEKVTWSVAPTDNGVSIDATTGTIAVGAKAKAGDYTITATPKNGSSQGEKKSATLTVNRAESVYTVTVTSANLTLTVPTGTETSSSQFFAAVKDQYDERKTDATVTWSVDPSDKGVSVDRNGLVTVSADAKGYVTGDESQRFTVKAAYTDAIYGTETLTVARATANAAKVEIGGDTTELLVPADEDTVNTSASYTVTVTDQYDATIKSPSVTWSISPKVEGVSIMETTGVVTVTNTAKNTITDTEGVKFIVTAKCGEVTGTKEITIKRADPTLSGFNVLKDGVKLTGNDTIVIDPNKNIEVTYTAQGYDQYGAEMDAVCDSIILQDKDNTTVSSNGKLTVSKDATPADYKLVITKSGLNKIERTISVVNKKDPGLTITGKNEVTYGDTFMLTASAADHGTAGGKWGVSGINSSILEVVKHDGSELTLKALKAGETTFTMTYEDEEYYGTKTVEVTVTPKEVTVGQGSFKVSKVYNDTTAAGTGSGTLAVNGILDKDTGVSVTPTIPAYDDANVGAQEKLTLGLALTGEGKDNYKLKNATVEVPCEITPATLTIASATATNRDYETGKTDVGISGVTFTNTSGTKVVPAAGDYTVKGEMADANADENKPVTVTVTMKNANFTLEGSTFGTKVNIAKAAHDKIQTEMSAKYGNTATLNLKALNLPEGYTFGTIDTTDNDTIFADAPAIEGNTLSVKLAAEQKKVGKTGTITIPVSSTNYQKFNLIVTVTVLDKTAQTLKADAISVKYGDSFTPTVKDAKTDVTYEVKEGSASLLKIKDGKFVATGVGTAHIVASAAETSEYAPASLDITVTIAKRPLTVKADDKTAYVGAQQPELTYTATGLVGEEKLTTEPTLKLVHEADVDPMKKAGTYEIIFETQPAASENYELTTQNGTLTVRTRHSSGTTGSTGGVSIDRPENGKVTVSPANPTKGSTVTITVTPNKDQKLKSLEVIDQNGNSLPLTDLGNGKFSFVMPAGKVTVKPVFGAGNAYVNPYMDVQTNDWYFGAVQYVTENGLMNGTGNGFEPNLATSRAMIWTILARMSNVNTASGGEWYAVAQQWAKANGVSDGTMPNGTITREQLAAMLYRYAVSKGMVKAPVTANLGIFAGASSVSTYANEAMQWAVSTGLINGMDGKLNPQGSATRAQVATMLMRFAELLK